MALSGIRMPPRKERLAQTASATVRFSGELGAGVLGDVPGLFVEARNFLDKNPRQVAPTAAELSAVRDVAALRKLYEDLHTKNKAYFNADELGASSNERWAVSSLRLHAFFETARASLRTSGLGAALMDAGTECLKRLEVRLYMARDVVFDIAKHNTYHPYSIPYKAGLERVRDLASDPVVKKQVEAMLAYIADRKTLSSSSINESDAESCIGQRAIDRGNAGQAISLAKTAKPGRPEYVVMALPKTGLPSGMEAHAGKAVYRDGNDYFFDRTATKLPAGLEKSVVEKPASSRLGLRPFEAGEASRSDFPFDWNRNGAIDLENIDTSWWGHCHIQTGLAILGLATGSELHLFDAAAGKDASFDKNAIDSILFALADCDRYEVDVSKTGFVGNRNDSTNSPEFQDRVILALEGGRTLECTARIDGLYDSKDATKRVQMVDEFQPTRVTTGIRFEKNPAFKGVQDEDWSFVDGKRKLELSLQLADVTQSGQAKLARRNVSVDITKPFTEPVLIKSELDSSTWPASVTRYYLVHDASKKSCSVEARTFSAKAKPDGTYEMVEAGSPRKLGAVKDVTLGKEMTKESLLEIHEALVYQGITGKSPLAGMPFVVEKSPDVQVWNYTDQAKLGASNQEDGRFEKYTWTLRTDGGTASWSYIVEYDGKGGAAGVHALSDPPDFLWQTVKTVHAPVAKDAYGSRAGRNLSMVERGMVSVDARRSYTKESFALVSYLVDLVSASLADKSKATRYAIRDKSGEMYLYDDKQRYDADVASLKQGTASPVVA